MNQTGPLFSNQAAAAALRLNLKEEKQFFASIDFFLNPNFDFLETVGLRDICKEDFNHKNENSFFKNVASG